MILFLFFLQCSAHHPDLHSFPTRRSSDLISIRIAAEGTELFVRMPALSGNEYNRYALGPEVRYYRDSMNRLVRQIDRKSTRLNSSHLVISYAVFCLKKKRQRREMHNTTYI